MIRGQNRVILLDRGNIGACIVSEMAYTLISEQIQKAYIYICVCVWVGVCVH